MQDFKDKTAHYKNFLVVAGLITLFLLIAGFCLSLIPSKSLVERAQALKRGDSKEKVRKILGKPTEVFLPPSETNVNIVTFLLCVHSETWAYGHWLCQSPNFPYFSLKLSLFQPDTNDIAVVFDSGAKVASVYIPNSETSKK